MSSYCIGACKRVQQGLLAGNAARSDAWEIDSADYTRRNLLRRSLVEIGSIRHRRAHPLRRTVRRLRRKPRDADRAS